MASSTLRLLPLFFLLTIISSTHARDSQFFSKVSRDNPDHLNNADGARETQLPNENKNGDVTKVQEGEPAFIPQTNEHGYGLYGPETSHNKYPSSTPADTKAPYTTTAKTAEYEEPAFYGNKDSKAYYAYNHDQENREQGVKTGEELQQQRSGYFYTSNDSGKEEEKKNFAEELHGLDRTRLTGSGYAAGEYQKGASSSNDGKNYGYNGGEKTGMSDTRYLENGKYFHDINSEKVNQQPNFYDTMRNDKYNTNNGYGGYYYYGNGNKDDSSNGYDHFNGNTNSQDQGNGMGYYQYNSNQGNGVAYGGGYYNNNNNYNNYKNDNNNYSNMGGYQYQHKGNNYNNQGQEEFEFDP